MTTHEKSLRAVDAEPAPRAWRDWLADHIGLDDAQKLEVYGSVARSATMRDATYWAEIVFAAGIVTMGLALGSPAVIIGAMLISPLMGPIMAAGLALAAGDLVLTIRAVLNIVVSCVIAVVFATLLVALLPFREMTPEIAARTHPNTLDLVVAFFSGAVGALAVSKSLRGVATSIPGVAIAVALMPPLGVTGYGIGVLMTVDRAQGFSVMRGGALLFLTNLIAITFSSMLVFLALHVDAASVSARIREWRSVDRESLAVSRMLERLRFPREMGRIGSLPARLVILVTLLGAIFVPLKRSFDALSREIQNRNELNLLQRQATDIWQERFANTATGTPRSYIDVLEAKEDEQGRTQLTMRVFTSRALSADEREAYVEALSRSLRRKADAIALTLVEIPTSRFEIATRTRPEPATPVSLSVDQQLEAVRRRLAGVLAATTLPPGATLLDPAMTLVGTTARVTLPYLAATPISIDAQSLVIQDVQARLGMSGMRVVLRWVPQSISITFEARSITLPPTEQEQLLSLAETMRAYPSLVSTVQPPDGSRRAQDRATVIVEALRVAGVAEHRIVAGTPRAAEDDTLIITLARANLP